MVAEMRHHRLAHHVFELCWAASTLLCAASLAGWVLGYEAPMCLLSRERPAVAIYAWPQAWYIESIQPTRSFGVAVRAVPPLSWRVPREVLPQWVSDGQSFRLEIPYWIPVAVFGAFPAGRWSMRRRRWHRARVGLCPQCGYDLRASPDRCPECGTPAAK
jgi:hypothetical protein